MTRRPRERAGAALLCAVLAWLPCAVAADDGEWSLRALMSELGKTRRAEARFVERKYLKVLDRPLVSSGRLIYVAPGRLEKRTLAPRPETLIVSADTLVIESANRGRRTLRLRDYPVLWGFVESFRGTLGGDLGALERFYAVGLGGEPADWELVLAPRPEQMRAVISQIRIRGSRGSVREIEVTEAQGDRSVMRVFEDDS